jgi:hypothetical protein
MFEKGTPFSGSDAIVKIILCGIGSDNRTAHADAVHASKKSGEENQDKIHIVGAEQICRNDESGVMSIPFIKVNKCLLQFKVKILRTSIEKVATIHYLAQSSFDSSENG